MAAKIGNSSGFCVQMPLACKWLRHASAFGAQNGFAVQNPFGIQNDFFEQNPPNRI
jgi:hypothetical protein